MKTHALALLAVFALHAADTALPSKRMPDGKHWTTRNLNTVAPHSYCYADREANCAKYGRLYTWESAREACASLGSGWRLPTDAEWGTLAQRYGGKEAAYRALLAQGSSGFDAMLGGGRQLDGQYARLDAHGFYWTATEAGAADAVYYNFAAAGQALHRQDSGEKQSAFAVRCVRD